MNWIRPRNKIRLTWHISKQSKNGRHSAWRHGILRAEQLAFAIWRPLATAIQSNGASQLIKSKYKFALARNCTFQAPEFEPVVAAPAQLLRDMIGARLEGREVPSSIAEDIGDVHRMSRIALVGSIFVAVLFLVCVGFFIARRPVSPQPNRTSQQAPSPAAPTPSPSEQRPAAVPTPPPVKITAAPSAAPATVHPAGAHFTVDSGLFQDRNNAETLAARIPKQYKTEITPLTVRGKKLYRVRTTVPSESDANTLAANLARDLHLQARITPIHQP